MLRAAPRHPELPGTLNSSAATKAAPSAAPAWAGRAQRREGCSAVGGTVPEWDGDTASRSGREGCQRKVTAKTGTASLFYPLAGAAAAPSPPSHPLALSEWKGVGFVLSICLLLVGTDPRWHRAPTAKPAAAGGRPFAGEQPGHTELRLSLGLSICLNKRGRWAVSSAITSG